MFLAALKVTAYLICYFSREWKNVWLAS